MSVKYNAELIDNLYKETDSKKAIAITAEMREIGEPIFILPIFSAYQKFKNSHVSHYFIVDLMGFENPEATEILKKILFEDIPYSADVTYLIDFCIKNEFFPDEFTEKVIKVFYEDFEPSISSYEIDPLLKYFLAVGRFSEVETLLVDAFEGNDFNIDEKAVILKALLKYNPKHYFQYYFDNYEHIKGTKSENILANEITGWDNGIIPQFKEKIIRDGSDRAREIIEEKMQKEKAETIENEKEIEKRFNNAQVLTDISLLREKVNTLTTGDVKFGFPLFSPAELLYQQTIAADNKEQLIGYCMVLRSVIQSIHSDVCKHGITDEEIKEKFPDIVTDGSINNLFLFLSAKTVIIDKGIFGLRDLNKTVAKLAHPNEDKEKLIEQLKSVNLFDLYKNEDWYGLHKKFLDMYRDFLITLHKAILSSIEKNTANV